LTRCLGNTRGSLADPSVYPKQFKCIKDQGMGRFWIPAHLLHGETRRRPTRNLHGPGNEKRNIIIAHTAVNRQMNASVEEPALTRAYDLNQVLWYESKVDSYVPGDEFFAESITVNYGLFDMGKGTQGPRLGGGTFKSPAQPPSCPTALGAPTAPPALLSEGEADFNSTLKICLNALISRVFPVKNGGLRVIIRANWAPARGTGPALACPASDYNVSLERKGLVYGFNRIGKSLLVPAGKSVSMIWKMLPSDDYRIMISVPDHNPSCCLAGAISVFTFDAPRPKRGEIIA